MLESADTSGTTRATRNPQSHPSPIRLARHLWSWERLEPRAAQLPLLDPLVARVPPRVASLRTDIILTQLLALDLLTHRRVPPAARQRRAE